MKKSIDGGMRVWSKSVNLHKFQLWNCKIQNQYMSITSSSVLSQLTLRQGASGIDID